MVAGGAAREDLPRRSTAGAPWRGDRAVRRALEALCALLPAPAHLAPFPDANSGRSPDCDAQTLLELLLLVSAWQTQHGVVSSDLLQSVEQHWPTPLRDRWQPTLERAPVALRHAALERAGSLPALGTLLENLLAWQIQPTGTQSGTQWRVVERDARRRTGSHFTPEGVARQLVERCLTPLLQQPQAWRDWRVIDPALGAGGLLLAALRWLTEHLPAHIDVAAEQLAYELVRRGAFGIDISPLAVLVSHLELSAFARAAPTDDDFHHALAQHLVVADALFGYEPGLALDGPEHRSNAGTSTLAFPAHSPAGLPRYDSVFERPNAGFDAIVSNPPWVAYAGRAAQPLSEHAKAYFRAHYASFHKYRTLHGLFIERCARLLRRGGRLGLLLPSSVADLAGYAPTRAAHDRYCEADASLTSFGEHTFKGILQPTMALHSTRRNAPAPARLEATVWRLERPDLCPSEQRLLERLQQLERIPPHLFGERGYQTTPADRAQLKPWREHLPSEHVALLTGTEVMEYRTLKPRFCVNPRYLSGRLRPDEAFRAVALVIRQTARYPIASLSPGLAFRNSVLAGFEDGAFPAPLLLAYLNSTPVRWFHFQTQRDARQGMPQTKITHLRSLPKPPALQRQAGRRLFEWGSRLGTKNQGIQADERDAIDRIVGEAWELRSDELTLIFDWGRRYPPPKSRSHPNGEALRVQAEGQA